MPETIAVLDFGSQYTQVIARRLRECQVYSRVYRFDTPISTLKKDGVCGIILSGGPSSVFAETAPMPDKDLFSLNVPVLGICYGLQLIGFLIGGSVDKSNEREYGRGTLNVNDNSPLFDGIPTEIKVWNSHGDKMTGLPEVFSAIATTENSDFAAIENPDKRIWG